MSGLAPCPVQQRRTMGAAGVGPVSAGLAGVAMCAGRITASARCFSPELHGLELELQLDAEVLRPLEEELAEGHRRPLILEQQPRTVGAAQRCPFETPGEAHVRGPPYRLHR